MIIKVFKRDDEIETIMINNGEESNFDYISMLNALYNNESIELSFENIDEELNKKINELFEEFKKIQPKNVWT